MIDTVYHGYLAKFERVDPFEACDIETVLLRIGAALVMGIDSTGRTEIVPRCTGVKLVKGQEILTAGHFQAVKGDRCHYGAPSPAHGAVAAAKIFQPIGQDQLQFNSGTVAGCLANGFVCHFNSIYRITSK